MATVPFRKIVVASRVGVFEESIEHDRSGVLVPPGDAGALADVIRRLASDAVYRERLRRGADEFFEQIPSWEQIGAQTRSVYKDAIAAHQSERHSTGGT